MGLDAALRGLVSRWVSVLVSEKAAVLDFDVFNRHSRVAERIAADDLLGGHILDVGGRLNSLRRFVDLRGGGGIFVLNRDLNDLVGPGKGVVHAVQGDGARIPFPDNAFPVVTSITTLEHIDKNERWRHIEELLRVSSGKVLVYIPVGPDGELFEKRLYRWSINKHIKCMTKQHIDNGLPSLVEMRRGMPGCSITPVQNAHVWLGCMLLKQVPLAWIFVSLFLYPILGRLRVGPYYEYLIEYDKKKSRARNQVKKTILIVSKCLPRFDQGSGHVRMLEMIKLLLQDYSVVFVADKFVRSDKLDDGKYADLLTDMGVEVFSGNTRRKFLKINGFDLVVIAWYETAMSWLPEIRHLFPSIPVIVDSVDVHFARELQMAEVYQDELMRDRALRAKSNELSVYRAADEVWAVTESDRRIINQHDADIEVSVIPNIHDFQPVDRSRVEPNSILFVGNFLHQPNVDAMVYFCRAIFPRILEIRPDIVLYVVGNAPPLEVRRLESHSIKVTGWVLELRPYLETCCLEVVPLRYGGGLKGKVGEAMMAGIPVVTSPVGIQGMDVEHGRHLMVANTDDEFIREVVTLLGDMSLCRELAENAARYVNERYSPSVVKTALQASLVRLLFNQPE